MQTQLLRWTVATALVAGIDDVAQHSELFAARPADAIALQGVSRNDAEALAERLGMTAIWSLSYYRHSPVIKSSGVGLAVLSRHPTQPPAMQIVSGRESTWSRSRRIAQTVTVERPDHSAYAIQHSLDETNSWPEAVAPKITIRPQQVGIDDSRAIELPPKAVEIEIHPTVALPGGTSPLLATSFSQPWVVSNVPL